MAKNQTIAQITGDFLRSLASNPSLKSDFLIIVDSILHKVAVACKDHNDKVKAGAITDSTWKIPDTLAFWQIADIMQNLFTIKRVSCCPQNSDSDYDLLCIYVDENVASHTGMDRLLGLYTDSEDIFKLLASKFNPGITSKETDELIQVLRRDAPRASRTLDRDLVPVNNGIFNYRTKMLEEFTPDKIFMVKSAVDYNPAAQNPVLYSPEDGMYWDVENWMKELSDDPEVVNLLWEIIGAIIRPYVRWNKSAWLYSESGNNGKGTLCELMRAICGDTGYASIPLSDFSKDFALEPLVRASAIIVDENDVGGFIDRAGNLKSVITNDVIQINRKFKVPIAYQFYGFMVQCLNEFPRIRDKSDSFYRRQLFIPMTKCFTGHERKYIKEDYLHREDVLEYILKRVLHMNYYKLSEPASCVETLTEYKEFNDPVRQFFDELCEEFTWDVLPYTYLYELFKAWFKLNQPSGTLIGKNTFVNNLIQIIKPDSGWIAEKNKQVLTAGKMNRPEPLNIQYNLTNWLNANYKGQDPNKLAIPSNVPRLVRGLERIPINNPESPDGGPSDTPDNMPDKTDVPEDNLNTKEA